MSGCKAKAKVVSETAVNGIPKRHGATSPLYSLDATQSAKACAMDKACSSLPPPAPPAPQHLRFFVLNGNFNANDTAWYDLDGGRPGGLPFSWSDAWVSSVQMEWLAEQLAITKAEGGRAIVFLHYRLDGGPGGPVVCTPESECGKRNNRAWVDDCTLKNAAAVRAIIEESGVVLATFGGHDHVPIPPYSTSQADGSGVLYFTHFGMIEGPYKTSNAYSIVDVYENCTISIQGFANASSLVYPGPAGCKIAK